jgi:acyl-CoA dehydrogenase
MGDPLQASNAWAMGNLGLSTVLRDEPGLGSSWVEAAALLGLAAVAAAPIPLAEHDVLGGWLLEVAGLADAGDLRTVTHERNLAGEPSDTVQFDVRELDRGVYVSDDVVSQYRLRGALARCAQGAGAMARVLEIVLAHVEDRFQLGRPIGRFQPVQALVADLAAEAALAQSATDAAVARTVSAGWSHPVMPFVVGVGKSCVGHASSVVVRNANQVLGTIGATLKHELPSLTKPILVRRADFGPVHEWDTMLGYLATAAAATVCGT